MPTATPALIVETDIEFLRRIHQHPLAQSSPPVVARTGREALSRLADPRFTFSAVFVSIGIQSPNLFSVIRFAHLKRPGVPIFILFDGGQTGLSDETLQSPAVQQLVDRESDYNELRARIDPLIDRALGGFAAEGYPSGSEASPIGTEVQGTDSDYVPILAKNFLSGRKSFFDVFVRLSSERYIKILRAGDGLDPVRLQTYLRKSGDYTVLVRTSLQHPILANDGQVVFAVEGESVFGGKVMIPDDRVCGEFWQGSIRIVLSLVNVKGAERSEVFDSLFPQNPTKGSQRNAEARVGVPLSLSGRKLKGSLWEECKGSSVEQYRNVLALDIYKPEVVIQVLG